MNSYKNTIKAAHTVSTTITVVRAVTSITAITANSLKSLKRLKVHIIGTKWIFTIKLTVKGIE